MRRVMREHARLELERRVRWYRRARVHPRPPEGWLRAMRLAVGVPAQQIADQMGFTPRMVFQTERAEQRRNISLERLERMARAVGVRSGVRAGSVGAVAGGSRDGIGGAGGLAQKVYKQAGRQVSGLARAGAGSAWACSRQPWRGPRQIGEHKPASRYISVLVECLGPRSPQTAGRL
jgi:transcriptional regulator with XRE-family HTH domain